MNLSNPVAETPPPGNPWQRSAFTLIELLVVIAVIGILASLLLPSLARTKSQAQGAFCQNDARQLMLGCLMYCDDNGGFFPYNQAGAAVHTNINWAMDVLDWETTPDNTNTALLTDAALGPYVARSSAIYHCPSDTVLSTVQHSAGWPRRARSYSMNASVGDAGEITQSGVNTNNPELRPVLQIVIRAGGGADFCLYGGTSRHDFRRVFYQQSLSGRMDPFAGFLSQWERQYFIRGRPRRTASLAGRQHPGPR